ncbi:efflux transporter, RND family, MFP subunit [Alkalidesulfovibrio alkalitolerans DSM 16529]|uniref:Efflux transporter, RND family, MFP subunit n=1 Tax=Alkalidesulfovibrio alkalitolerans DSM 16529 TaxID=1121439 RepID=S7UJE5_9BACT|nr:efflux RND transporter periplasmic adaptor subunit [Alkalidesulfovibrio alkalitolerans]EPR32428.1 efflux transporter, RND family, MFP subunit [Alkalidesulfovibrio alkalitolerans DSM 16529]
MSEKTTPDGRKRRLGWWIAAIIGVFVLGFLLGGKDHDHPAPGERIAADGHEDHDHGGDATLWTCSMHPQVLLPEPGQCPICFMDLIPVARDDGQETVSLRQITLSPRAQKLAQVRTAKVERRDPSFERLMVGQVAYDETRLGTITAWMPGRIERLRVDFTGAFVRRGQPMADIYSPDLFAAQAELIQAVKSLPELSGSTLAVVRESARRTEEAAREKLRLLGLTPAQIEEIVARGRPSDRVTLHAPLSGVVIRREVNEGMYVQTGSPLFSIADISRVWVMLEAYESDLPFVRVGQTVSFTTDAFPGRIFNGAVTYIDPFLNEASRTARVRLEAANADHALKPGMYVRAVKRDAPDTRRAGEEPPLVIPASAPLITGKRAIVYVAVPGHEGMYEGREIMLGPRAGDWYIVRAGLSEGEEVVARGAFRIDSAVQIQARPSMMSPEPGGGPVGHDHGPAEHDHAAMEETMPDESGFTVPRDLARAVTGLDDSMPDLARAVESGDLPGLRAAAKNFYDRACAIDPQELTGDAALMWRELSMLLRNDSLILSEVKSPGEARFHFAELTRTMRRLTASFGRPRGDAPTAVAEEDAAEDFRADTPPAFAAQLGAVVSAYLPLTEALATDDLAAAQNAAAEIQAKLEATDMGLLPHDPHMFWMRRLMPMNEALRTLRAATDLAGARAALGPLSDELIAAVAGLGISGTGPVHEAFCPMVAGGQGGFWLQRGRDIRNPYFGPMMLACGEIRRTFGE